jgi:hypothetical protein
MSKRSYNLLSRMFFESIIYNAFNHAQNVERIPSEKLKMPRVSQPEEIKKYGYEIKVSS